jgi:hypothetical protein
VCAAAGSTVVSATEIVCGDADAGGPPAQKACLALPEAGTCPTNFGIALNDFLALGCPSGFEPYEILSGPSTDVPDQCCYMVHDILCGSGGRAYLVDGTARVASPARSHEPDWAHGDRPCVDGLASEERSRSAAAWAADAAAEHASIASFARFSLSLLAVGAPAELVTSAHDAALDEIRHARTCFALAAAYAGYDVEPGPFPVGDAVHPDTSLAALARSTALEGCVGETIAAVVAAERARCETDPAVRAALEGIAADEARHAELAWRTVAWAVRTGGEPVRAAAARALVDGIASASAATTASAVKAALIDVVGPAGRALLGRRGEGDQDGYAARLP